MRSDRREIIVRGIMVSKTAETINRIVGNQAGITYVADARSARDPQRRQPDITRARAILDWEPKIDLEEGLQKTIPYFKQKLGLK